MSEVQPESVPDESLRTGVAEVDAVLASLDDLDASEVSAHPAVFESAHDRLRRALDPDA